MSAIAKIILLALYAAAAASHFAPALAPYCKVLSIIAVLLLAVHVIEYFVHRKKLSEKAPGKSHFINMLLFGVIHVKQVMK